MFPNKLFRNILKYSKLFPLEHFWQLSKTLWVVLKHFFSLRHFEMFTNLFGNFLNVKEHFEMFQWNNQKCFQINSSENILKCSKLFSEYFWQLSRTLWVVLKHLFTLALLNVHEYFKKFQWNILKLFECSRTF